MIRNFFLTTFRSFLRYRYFTGINLMGLALGLSCSILILLWITDELKYDAFHVNGKRLYRVMENQTYADGKMHTASSTPGILAETLKAEVPEISHAMQTTWDIQELLTVGTESHKESGRYFSADFLEMFTFPLSRGDARTAMTKPNAILITNKIAHLYFPGQDPMGKTIIVSNHDEFEVTGVFEDIPFNSSLRFDFVLPYDTWLKTNDWAKSWENTGPRTFVMLYEGATQEAVDNKIRGFLKL